MSDARPSGFAESAVQVIELAEGKVQDGAIVCPWHGSRFALEDGRVLDGPATRAQPCFETRVRDGFVEVRWRPESGLGAA